MNLVEARGFFNNLESGIVEIGSISIGDLFAAASLLAVSGDLLAKNKIYEWIGINPKATAADKIRVAINRADWLRRQNEPRLALARLDGIGEPQDTTALLEWLQARGQCYLRLKNFQDALKVQLRVVEVSKQAAEAPDKYLYRLESVLNTLLMAGQNTPDVATLLDEYDAALEQLPEKEGAYYERGRLFSHWIRGRFAVLEGDLRKAVSQFEKAWTVDTGERGRTVAAMFWLSTVLKQGEDPKKVNKAVVRYFKDHEPELLPKDRSDYPEEHAAVMDYLK